jgi:heavy metal sensor kinase
MSRRSIGARLTFWYTVILGVTLLLVGGMAYGLLAYSLSQDVNVALQGIAQVIVHHVRQEGRTSLPPDVDELFRRFFGFAPSDRYFGMLNPEERPPENRPPVHAPLPISPKALQAALLGVATFETVKGTGPYPVRLLIAPVIEGGRVINVVQVGISLENMLKTLRRFDLIMAAVFPLGLLLAGGGGWLLARRALRPVDRMTQAVLRISSEHLQERLPEPGTGDELDRLAGTLNAMLTRLEDSFRQIRQFSADASHELQTPLTILRGEIEVALRSPRSPEDYQQVLRSGLEEIDRISRLVGGLLLLARADAGVLRLDLQPLDLSELVLDVAARMQRLAAAKNVVLHCDLPAPVFIYADKEHLYRLLLNLVDNAVKYTPPGGRVTLSLRGDDEQVRLAVTDTGIGLTPAEQAQIFTRFFRSAEAKSQGGGAGLGLCIAQSIAAAHGGAIGVASTPGQGSTFTVVLPASCPLPVEPDEDHPDAVAGSASASPKVV